MKVIYDLDLLPFALMRHFSSHICRILRRFWRLVETVTCCLCVDRIAVSPAKFQFHCWPKIPSEMVDRSMVISARSICINYIDTKYSSGLPSILYSIPVWTVSQFILTTFHPHCNGLDNIFRLLNLKYDYQKQRQ